MLKYALSVCLSFIVTALAITQSSHDLYVRALDDGRKVQVESTEITQEADIRLTMFDVFGREMWTRVFGGTSYEKAGGVCQTSDGGFVVVGATSSYGQGNYDAYIIKVDAKGNKVWDRVIGEFGNEYGYTVNEVEDRKLIITGRRQECESRDIFSCVEKPWTFMIDQFGNMLNTEVKTL